MQLEAPAFENDPATQPVQFCAPALLKLPAAHVLQAAAIWLECWPA